MTPVSIACVIAACVPVNDRVPLLPSCPLTMVRPGTLPIGVNLPCATLKVANRRSLGAASTSLTTPLGATSGTGVFWLVETVPDTLQSPAHYRPR